MRVFLFPCALALIALAACSDRSGVTAARHDYHAPHGGAIVRLGKEEYHLEFTQDAAAGKLTAYVLDGIAEGVVRVRAPSFEIIATVGPEKRPLVFVATPDPARGETVGDTSRFVAQADWLKTVSSFGAELTMLKISNTTFLHVVFKFPQGNERR